MLVDIFRHRRLESSSTYIKLSAMTAFADFADYTISIRDFVNLFLSLTLAFPTPNLSLPSNFSHHPKNRIHLRGVPLNSAVLIVFHLLILIPAVCVDQSDSSFLSVLCRCLSSSLNSPSVSLSLPDFLRARYRVSSAPSMFFLALFPLLFSSSPAPPTCNPLAEAL